MALIQSRLILAEPTPTFGKYMMLAPSGNNENLKKGPPSSGTILLAAAFYQDLGVLLIAGDSQSWVFLLPGRVLQAFPRLFRFDRFCQAVR
jgi:hypothetical protein